MIAKQHLRDPIIITGENKTKWSDKLLKKLAEYTDVQTKDDLRVCGLLATVFTVLVIVTAVWISML